MTQRAQLASGIRIVTWLLLAATLLLAILALFEPLILSLEPLTGSDGAANGSLIVPRAANADPFSATGWTVWTFVLATLLALPLSGGLLSFYRHAVVKSMRRRANDSGVTQAPAPNSLVRQNGAAPAISITDQRANAALSTEERRLLNELMFFPWKTAAAYAVAGLGFALLTAILVLISGNTRISSTRLLALTWLYAWPAAIAIYLVTGTTRRTRIAVISAYFIVYLIIAAIAIVVSRNIGFGQMLGLWMIENLLPTILVLIFVNHRVRAVGPLMLLLMIIAVFGGLVAPFLLFSNETQGLTGLAAGLLGGSLAFKAAQVLGFVTFGAMGWFALRYVRRLYEEKKLSDQTILLGTVWLQFAAFWFVGLAFAGYAWIIGVIPVFIAYIAVLRAGFAALNLRPSSSKQGRKLLVLRVFALGERSERLFEAVAKHWRYVGSIAQIAGPDLLKATVQPHEFLDFMSGKLSRRFIDGPEKLDLRLAETDLAADADGRFRVNDFFCYDDTWKLVLDHLVRDIDAVLMDLRGFSPQNAGCVFEIEELISAVPVARIVFIVDSTTSKPFLRQTINQAWRKMRPNSPNRDSFQLHLLRFEEAAEGHLQGLFSALCAAVQGH